MYDPLLEHIRKFVELSADEESVLLSHITTRTLDKKAMLLREGQVCHENYFVLKGCCYLSIPHETGTEQVVQFGIENWWITDHVSFNSGQPSKFNIRVIESTVVAVLDRKDEEALFNKIPKLERYFRTILQRAYSATLQRIQFIFTMSGEERYRHFSGSFPTFVQRIPQYVLASYLGITPEFLSKIRAKKI